MGGQKAGNPRKHPTSRHAAMMYGWQWSVLPQLWPGLPQLWYGSRWQGLAVAAGFALAVDWLLLTRLVWNELIGPELLFFEKIALATGWCWGVVVNRRWLKRHGPGTSVDTEEDLFPEAFAEYLQGNWFAAEQKCRNLIRLRTDDVEARLLLATLLRHVGRRDEARQELKLIDRYDAAAAWRFEIERERELLDWADQETADEERTKHEAERNDEKPADDESTTEDGPKTIAYPTPGSIQRAA